jgi:chemotaxis regulatin CheY-phosphate phosphatase CheZ
MKGANSLQLGEPFSTDLRKHARRLIEQLQNCDYQGASKLIQGMVEERDRQLVISVGQLTRALHNELIKPIRIAAQVEEVTGSQAPDADPETGFETEKPGESAPQRKLVESGQDDVDDLLSSLGF